MLRLGKRKINKKKFSSVKRLINILDINVDNFKIS